MEFKNHKSIFPADNVVYNRMKVGPKKNKIETDDNGTRWAINRYYVKKYVIPWITNWVSSPYSTVEIIEEQSDLSEPHDVVCEQIVFLYSSDLTLRQLFIAWIVQVIKSKSFVEIIDERINSQKSWLINISKRIRSNSKLIIYSTNPTESHTTADDHLKMGSVIYSSWFRNQIWNSQFDYVIREVKSHNDDLKNGNEIENPIRNEIIFDKCEDQTYSNNIIVGVASLVMYHCRRMTLHDLKLITFRVANCYRSIFSHELIQMKIQELIRFNIIKHSHEDTSIIYVSNEFNESKKISELINLCIPYLSLVSLVASGVINLAISNTRCTFADFEVEINELDSNLPIMDMIQVPFVDLGDSGSGDIDHIDIWNRTLRILLENNILEIENKDKFSAWWDLAQDANEGTTLYYLSDYPDITLLKILLEPIHQIIRSMLEFVEALPSSIQILSKCPNFERNYHFLRGKKWIEFAQNKIQIIDEEQLNEYIQLLVSFDSWEESYYKRL